MKHAGAAALDQVEALLGELRALPGVKEKSRGVFYLRGRAFLHFHEDPAGIFADVRGPDDWERFEVSAPAGREALTRRAADLIGP